MINRRSLFKALGAAFAAPAVVKVTAFIPLLEAARVRSVNYLTLQQITGEPVKLFVNSNAFLSNIDDQYAAMFAEPDAKIGSTLRIRMPSP